jgi:hypothetical protein
MKIAIKFLLLCDSMTFPSIDFSPYNTSIISSDNANSLSFSLLIDVPSVNTVIVLLFTELQSVIDSFLFALGKEL